MTQQPKNQSQPKNFISFFGMDIRDRKNYLQGVEIDASLKDRFAKSTAYCRFFSLFNHLGDRAYQRIAQLPIGQDPLFILGYSRSGTTFLHTLLSKDPQFAFTTNYHAGFPHLVLWGQSFFKRLRSIGRPKKRADKMSIALDLPQEEEQAIVGLTPYTFALHEYFPQQWSHYLDRYTSFEEATDAERNAFEQALIRVIRSSLVDCWGGEDGLKSKRFLSKSPAHSARIPMLLKLFPNAKFIYIARNPYFIYSSNITHFSSTFETLSFQRISKEELSANVLASYKKIIIDHYEQQKQLIPEGNLLEIRFEDFVAHPLQQAEAIYERLNLPGWEQAQAAMQAYVEEARSYKSRTYPTFSSETIDLVNRHWGLAIERGGYTRL